VKFQLVEKHINVDEHYIRYFEGGVVSSAKPILFIHGWAVGTEPYQEALNILCQHYQVIAPELPGFGTSGSRSDWDYNKYAEFLIAFLDKLRMKKSHLIGYSLGGGIIELIVGIPQMRFPQVSQMLQSLLYNSLFRTQNII